MQFSLCLHSLWASVQPLVDQTLQQNGNFRKILPLENNNSQRTYNPRFVHVDGKVTAAHFLGIARTFVVTLRIG